MSHFGQSEASRRGAYPTTKSLNRILPWRCFVNRITGCELDIVDVSACVFVPCVSAGERDFLGKRTGRGPPGLFGNRAGEYPGLDKRRVRVR